MFALPVEIPSPWMNAAGTLGYLPPARWPLLEAQGIFVTNPLSRKARSPAAERAAMRYPGGLLLHSGLPNPGFTAVLRKHAAQWARSPLPVWVHLIPANPAEAAEMARELENIEAVSAIEVGIEASQDPNVALDILAAAAGERPLVAALPLQAVGLPWLRRLPEVGVAALTLSAPRGSLPAANGKIVSGRLLGPSLFPWTLAGVTALRDLGLPVIAGAGVFDRSAAAALLAAGATAVQVDAALWRGWLA